jgi:hypothetical protein
MEIILNLATFDKSTLVWGYQKGNTGAKRLASALGKNSKLWMRLIGW